MTDEYMDKLPVIPALIKKSKSGWSHSAKQA